MQGGAPDSHDACETSCTSTIPGKLMAVIIFTRVQLQLYCDSLLHNSANHFPIIPNQLPMVSISSQGFPTIVSYLELRTFSQSFPTISHHLPWVTSNFWFSLKFPLGFSHVVIPQGLELRHLPWSQRWSCAAAALRPRLPWCLH